MFPLESLTAEQLACTRGQRVVFRRLDFSARAGEAISIEGPNGAGKTSLLRVLAGFLPPAHGVAAITAQDGRVLTEPEDRARAVGWLGHHDAVKPQLTCAETLSFFAGLYGGPRLMDDALEAVGLTRQRDLPGAYLSAGQKRRLALARLILSRRPLWLLDEPLSALDADGKRLAARLIASHCAGGGICLAATHEPLGLDTRVLQLGAA